MNLAHRKALKTGSTVLVLSSVALSLPLPAADLTIPNTFVPGTPATAADVNANFSATAAAVNSKQNLVTGTCPTGQALRGVNPNGSVLCQPLSFIGGDGSAGNLTVASNLDWSATPPVNPNFANCTINSGITLTVPAGTTIRCSGSFTNNGTISVLPGATSQGASSGLGETLIFCIFPPCAAVPQPPANFITAAPHPGDTPGPAAMGQSDNTASTVLHTLQGGTGGLPIQRTVAQTSFGNFRMGGGAGGAYSAFGGQGGGLLKVYSEGPIVNAGGAHIVAQGDAGSGAGIGGGGGGIVVLASRASVTNSGTIDVSGGAGGAAATAFLLSTAFAGNGGGGGGGIVVMASPIAPVLGTVTFVGGAGGTGAGPENSAGRIAGGGGGGSGGAGGNGGDLNAAASATPTAGGNGGAGYAITITADPVSTAR